jgi:hypothetical protein
MRGPKPKPPTTVELEIYAWWQAKKALGSNKTKARELGVETGFLEAAIRRMRNRHSADDRRQRRKFMASLKECPF